MLFTQIITQNYWSNSHLYVGKLGKYSNYLQKVSQVYCFFILFRFNVPLKACFFIFQTQFSVFLHAQS